MAIIAHRFGFKFEKYKINLCGAFSTIQLRYSNAPKVEKYELYFGINGVPEERFNTALKFLLESLQSLIIDIKAKMSKYPRAMEKYNFRNLYAIEGENINGQSIKYKSNDSSTWTSSMKYLLTNLQFCVFMTQLKDIYDQEQNVNMEKKENNFNISGL